MTYDERVNVCTLAHYVDHDINCPAHGLFWRMRLWSMGCDGCVGYSSRSIWHMTQDELDALSEIATDFGIIQTTDRQGNNVRLVVFGPQYRQFRRDLDIDILLQAPNNLLKLQ